MILFTLPFFAVSPPAFAQTVQTATWLGSTAMLCRLTDATDGNGQRRLKKNFGIWGADLGYPVFDGSTTWLFFGDTDADDPNTEDWTHGADSTGYFSGADPTVLCTSNPDQSNLQFVPYFDGSGMAVAAFSPDLTIAPNWGQPIGTGQKATPIRDFISRSPSPPPSLTAMLPAHSDIPGDFETPSGAFFYNGQMFIFQTGSPETNAISGFPLQTLSYLTVWNPSSSAPKPFPTERAIISAVDYTTQNQDATCSSRGCPVPTGWPSIPPLGGGFVRVAPVVTNDFVYLFGTGVHDAGWVSLARLPVSSLADVAAGKYPFLSSAPGLQVWTNQPLLGMSVPGWSASPPTPHELNNLAPLFSDDIAPDVGTFSVQRIGGQWMMMYNPHQDSLKQTDPLNQTVVLRTAPDPTGPWSSATKIVDVSSPADAQELCCGTAVQGVCSANEIIWCSETDFYAPYLFPFSNSTTATQQTGLGLCTDTTTTVTYYYALSAFRPYGATLMTFSWVTEVEDCAQKCLTSPCQM
jgi:hypothetical protein